MKETYDNNDYIETSKFVERTDHSAVSDRLQKEGTLRLLHASFGFCTEAGEFQDALKRHLFYGDKIDTVNLVEELGGYVLVYGYCL